MSKCYVQHKKGDGISSLLFSIKHKRSVSKRLKFSQTDAISVKKIKENDLIT